MVGWSRLGRLLAGLALAAPAGAADLAYTDSAQHDTAAVVIDSRPLADCQLKTLPQARCLPADDFLGPHRRLPNERDLLWLLGTVGLDGSEAVLVVGEQATARDFVAGVLYLAGQRQVAILTEPMTRVLAARRAAAPGAARGIVRTAIYTAPMRADLLVLKRDLMRDSATIPLDGRSELEYWGETVRAARGGHLPGAMSLPATTLAGGAPPLLPTGSAVAYAHDAYEGIAYFTRLVAGFDLPLRVYAGGWAEWAADGNLPVDAATYPERRAEAIASAPPAPRLSSLPLALAAAGALVATFAGGWYLSKRRMT